MASNPSLYRYIDFIGGNILDASNMTLLQTVLERTGGLGLGQIYAEGAMLNASFNITGTSIVFTGFDPTKHVFAFINTQFEDLGASVAISGTQPTLGSANPLFLNWSWDIKTSADDGTFVDGITGEPTLEAGQLSFQVSWVDTSGVVLNPNIQFGKNTSPIILAYFDMSVVGHVTPTYINGVAPMAWGNPRQAGFIRLTPDSQWISSVSTFTLGQQIVDTNGNIQQVTAIGTTGVSQPTWNPVTSGITVDGTVTWTNEGPVIRGEAISVSDVSVTNARNPNPGSVYNSSVAPLISSGFNSTTLPGWVANNPYTPGFQIVDSNGNIETVVATSGTGTSGASTPSWNLSLGGQTIDNAGANQVVWINGGTASTVKYDPATAGQGGIFTDSIIYNTLKQKLTTFLDTVNTSVENALVALTNHIGKPLGSAQTHPFPTAFQVGAAPASHVGQVLGLGTSHPAQVNSDHGGFVVLRNPLVVPVTTDYAYSLTDGTNVLAGIKHTGDIFSQLSNLANAQGGNGAGGTAVFTGTLGLISLIANVLAEHVNYKTHGNNNPHNIDAADIGAVSAAFVNAQISNVVADTTAYTDARANVAVRVSTETGRNIGVRNYAHHAPGSLPANTTESISYSIFNFGGAFEIAIGTGHYFTNGQVALPEASGWSSSNFICDSSVQFLYGVADDQIGLYISAVYNPGTRIVLIGSLDDGGQNFVINDGWAHVVAIGWRAITPPAFIISSFDNTAGTFNAGHVGDSVTITGRNFGATQGTSSVRFNGTVVVSYTAWSSTSITVVVPAGATTGLISVTIPPAPAVNSPFIFTIS